MNMNIIITRAKQLSKSVILAISAAVLLFSASLTRDVYALPSACEGIEDRQQQLLCVERLYQRDNISFLEPSECAPGANCTPCTGEGGGVPTGSNNQERAFRFFITKGMAPNQAAGFVGNLMAESGPNIDPTAVNPSSGAYGVAQWLGSRLTGLNSYASQNGGNREDFDIQMNYLWDVDIPAQINGGFPDIGRVTQNNPSMSVEEATEVILLEFERPGVGERKLEQRIGWARGVLQLYGNGTGGSSTTGCAGSESGRVIDGFVLYNQYDEKWANKPYGSSTIAEAGCGPSSIAMVVATLTGDRSVTPETVAARYGEEYYVPGEGSSWGLMENAPSDYGLTSQNIGTDIEAAKAAIRNGALVIASGKGAKPFTSGGHILVLRGVTDDGKILIGDSGHRDTSETPHEQSALTASIVNMWVVSK